MRTETRSDKLGLLKRLWLHLPAKRRRQFFLLFIVICISSFAEVLSIGAVLPFLTVISAPETVFQHEYLRFLWPKIGVTGPEGLLLPVTLMFSAAAVFSGSVRLFFLWLSTRVSFSAGSDLSMSIYSRTLYQPYEVHISRNSSEVVTGIMLNSKRMIASVILPVIQITSSIFIVAAVMSFLVRLNPVLILAAFSGFGVLYAALAVLVRKNLNSNGVTEAREHSRVIKMLQESLGGIRQILLDDNQKFHITSFGISDHKLRQASALTTFLSSSPKFIFETLGMVLIALMAYSVTGGAGKIDSTLPMLGSIALAAQRMLPVLQQGYQSWANFKSSRAIVEDVLALLDQPVPEHLLAESEIMPFRESIRLKDVWFRYGPEEPWVLSGIDLTIEKGSKVGFVGVTGSGKSTLVDIIMGLLPVTKGEFTVDGVPIRQENVRSWQKNLSNVPQNIFLSDSSISENIAFGKAADEIDPERVRRSAENAQISSFIDTLENGYETEVGEQGVRLSGGQRQRIGIARALYKNAETVIFDEATSALDSETEEALMRVMMKVSENLTVLMIAHRTSTLRDCDKIIRLADGKIAGVGRYSEIFAGRET